MIIWRLLQLVRLQSRAERLTASGSKEKLQPLRKLRVCGENECLHISLYKQEMKCHTLLFFFSFLCLSLLHAVVTHSGVQVHFNPSRFLVKRSWKWRCKQELKCGPVSLHFRGTVSKDIEASCLWGRSWNLKHLGKAPGTLVVFLSSSFKWRRHRLHRAAGNALIYNLLLWFHCWMWPYTELGQVFLLLHVTITSEPMRFNTV